MAVAAEQQHCSEIMRESGVGPIGSAPSVAAFLLVETPRPWASDVHETASLRSLQPILERAARQGRPHRLQAVAAPSDPADGPGLRVVRYAADPERHGRLQGEEHWCASAADLPELCEAVVTGGERPRRQEPLGTGPLGTEVLVCTHGARDRCCGSAGTRLAAELAQQSTGAADPRVWRTSHLGGHRFAPTAVTLPDARAWGFVTADLLQALFERRGAIEDVLASYRGSCLAPNPAVQAAEREAFLTIGWDWLDVAWRSDAWVVEGDETRVLLSYESPQGATGTFDVVVRSGPSVLVPPCMGAEGEGVRSTEMQVVASQPRWP